MINRTLQLNKFKSNVQINKVKVSQWRMDGATVLFEMNAV